MALGIVARAEKLARGYAGPATKSSYHLGDLPDLRAALDRLILPEQMGTLFKVLALTHPGLATPPGFEG